MDAKPFNIDIRESLNQKFKNKEDPKIGEQNLIFDSILHSLYRHLTISSDERNNNLEQDQSKKQWQPLLQVKGPVPFLNRNNP